ncbi:MAG: alpha-L-fucosidase [Bacteroidales bacterium]
MKIIIKQIFLLIPLYFFMQPDPPPQPFGPTPSERQLEWHTMKYYAFIHFGLNTFTDREWGFGNESPAIFNPTELDCRQWARVARDAGMEGIIITAKHHDGFCLWPSQFTEHSVKNSPWRDGEGDLIAELSEACREYGLKFGIYLSPWDRNHALYGTPAYIDYYRSQLRELLTNYGEIFEVWFDGANGGDGYYGGSNETRRIDNTTYYDWENTWKIVRELQPGAVMFSDGGPDIRWIGNERGYADETNWCTMPGNMLYPGIGGVNELLQKGNEEGDTWLPAEVNTSIRPGWFYHESQDSSVKSIPQLADIWMHSIGMNGNLLLNLPVDRRGLIHENDIAALMGLRRIVDSSFNVNYALEADISASNVRGDSREFSPSNLSDGNSSTYWATDDGVNSASIEISMKSPNLIDALMIQEYIELGQRITGFSVEIYSEGGWKEVSSGTTVGNRRIVNFKPVETGLIRVNLKARACPIISNIEIYQTGLLSLQEQLNEKDGE